MPHSFLLHATARVIMDRETGRSRGFGFVTYADSEAASAAIQAMDQRVLIMLLSLFGYLLYYTLLSHGNCNFYLTFILRSWFGFNQKLFNLNQYV